MKMLAFCLLCAQPALAWDFSPDPICILENHGSVTDVKVTYDGAVYTLYLTHPEGWVDAPQFALGFLPVGPNIRTDRHIIVGNTLSVADSGFGNVLAGLQLNLTAVAKLGETVRMIDLSGAEAPTNAFRACDPPVPLS